MQSSLRSSTPTPTSTPATTPATPATPSSPSSPKQAQRRASQPRRTSSTHASKLSTQLNRLSLSRAVSFSFDPDDDPQTKIRSSIDKHQQSLRDGIEASIFKAEGSAHHIARGYDPTEPLSSSIGGIKDTSAPTQMERLSALLAVVVQDSVELVTQEFAGLCKAVFPELEDSERRWIDRIGRKERDMNSECSQRMQKQRDSFWKDLDEEEAKREVALADLGAQHEKTLAELKSQHEKTLAELKSQHEKTLAELKSLHEKARDDDEQRRVRDLADLQALFEHEASLWNAQYQIDMKAANDRTAAEMAARQQTEVELASSREAASTLRGELEDAHSQIFKIRKDMLEETRKKEADDAARKKLDEQREKDSRRREEEVAKKDAQQQNYFDSWMSAKREQLNHVTGELAELKVTLQKEKERCQQALEDKRLCDVQIAMMSKNLSRAESQRDEIEAQWRVAERGRKVAEDQRLAANALQMDAEKKYQTCEKEMLAAKFAHAMAEDARKKAQKKLDDILVQHRTELAQRQTTIDSLRRQLAEAKKNGSSGGGGGVANTDVHRRMHDSLWAFISGSPLKFSMIGWPVTNGAKSLDDLTPSAIRIFVLDSRYAQGRSDRDRVREAIRTWHPDKFYQRLAGRIADEDVDAIKEGVDTVSKCLNNMLAQVRK
ncbi:hypothetical protein DENSPDRAFT_196358 [Dentipellis sp. KUC8613]|nr:hypothetical protein DENSPDRAFT_196358 [Dentipellis sp. KUC8613]